MDNRTPKYTRTPNDRSKSLIQSFQEATHFQSHANFNVRKQRIINDLLYDSCTSAPSKRNRIKSIRIMPSPKSLGRSIYSIKKKGKVSITSTPLILQRHSVPYVANSNKLQGFIEECRMLMNKSTCENKKIKKCLKRTEFVRTPKRLLNSTTHKLYNRLTAGKVFIFGEGMKGRYIRGPYNDIVANCNRITHADCKLTESYYRLTQTKF